MGIENRDYLRSDSRSGPRWSGGATSDVVKGLIIANVVVFVLQLLWTRPLIVETPLGPMQVQGQRESVVQGWLELDADKVIQQGQIWRLLTYAFCHSTGTPWHILMNMYILFLTGRALQQYYGSREFLLFYLTAAVVSGLGFVLLNLVVGRESIAIGASGAVTAVLMMYALIHPQQVWYIFGIIPMKVIVIAILMMIYDLYPVLAELGGQSHRDSIAHSAHLAGYLFGFLYYRNNWRLAPLLDRLHLPKLRSLKPSKSRLKVYHPEKDVSPADLDERVDVLLQKVHERGEASLSDSERAFLAEASRKYRNKL